MPMNYFPEGAPTVFAELWFQTDMSVLGQECQNLEQKINGETIIFDNLGICSMNFFVKTAHIIFPILFSAANETKYLTKGDSVLVLAQLIDPKGNIRVTQEKWLHWNNETIRYFPDPKDGLNRTYHHGETSHTFALTVGYLESGLWIVRVFKGNSTNKVWHIFLN